MAFSLPPPPGINQFNSASWQDWFYKLRTALIQAFNALAVAGGLPPGGATSEVLTKLSATDGDADWLPVPVTAVTSPGNNIVHNSYFQEREYSVQDDVVFATTAPYKQHARRWYGVAPTTDFKTLIDTGHDAYYLTIKRTAGNNTGAVRLVQILDTEDSVKFSETNKTLWTYFGLNTGANVTSVTFKVSYGTGIDQSLASYLAGTWTGQTQVASRTTNGGYDLFFDDIIGQVAFEIRVVFSSTASATDDEVYIYGMFVTDRGIAPNANGIMACSKSRALTRQECNRYYQQMDLYLTTTEINVPIHMRAVPTVTLGDAAAFTTTGTTADSLVIKVNGTGDNGLHTVYLSCEL